VVKYRNKKLVSNRKHFIGNACFSVIFYYPEPSHDENRPLVSFRNIRVFTDHFTGFTGWQRPVFFNQIWFSIPVREPGCGREDSATKLNPHMKNRLLILAAAFLGMGSAATAQFGNSYFSGATRNNSGFVIEHFVQTSGAPGYITATTCYPAPGSPTNGIRVIATNTAGGLVFDRKFTSFTDIHVMDICRDAATNTYLGTGYLFIGGAYRPFIVRMTAAGTLVAARYYIPAAPYNTYHFQALSITPFNGNQFAIVGFGTPLQPTQANASAQTNQQMFITLVDINLNQIATTGFNHVITFNNNILDVPIHVTDVPGIGLHVTGAMQANIPGRAEGVLNVMFDYGGNMMWEQSFIDLTSEDVEIGQYSYYDSYWGLLYVLSYKYNSRTVGVYAVDPSTGWILSGSDYSDPLGQLHDIYGLSITKDDVSMPDELFITGYVIFSSGYPWSSTSRLPVFTTKMNIIDLIVGTSNTVNFNMYDIPNDQYRFFNFSNHMLASTNTVIRVPTNLGFTPQMAILDPASQDIIISSPRISNMFGGWHPTITQHTAYYNDACSMYTQPINYDFCMPGLTPLANYYPYSFSPITLPSPVTMLPSTPYGCGAIFTPNSGEDENMLGTDVEESVSYRIYPTLVSASDPTLYLELSDAKDSEIQISIYDASGRLLHQLNRSVFAGDTRIEIPADNLAPGMNVIRINGLDKPVTQKIMRAGR